MWAWLLSLIGAESGKIYLSAGKHEVDVATKFYVSSIWFTIVSYGTPVCHGSLDTIAYTITDEGYTLYADIKSNKVVVKWFAYY